jgi:hypothetical protein
MHENRETSASPDRSTAGRPEKALSRTSGAHEVEESDRTVVPMNQPNKAAQQWPDRGGWGGKGADQGEHGSGPHAPDTEREQLRIPGAGRCASSSIMLRRHASEVGAVCGSSARTDLCGGRSAMAVPTATRFVPVLFQCPCLRFDGHLAITATKLGVRMVRYSFPVGLFHPLRHAGLSRRTSC